MKLTFINVGYGEAILIETGSTTWLIDGGSAEAEEFADSPARNRCITALRKMNVSKIDVMISTHPHEDHICGLWEVARELPVGRFYAAEIGQIEGEDIPESLAPNASTSKFIRALNASKQMLAYFREKGVPVERLCAGDSLNFPEISASVLAPTSVRAMDAENQIRDIYDALNRESKAEILRRIQSLDAALNNYSIVLKIQSNNLPTVLLVGDNNRNGYSQIAPESLHADLFKIGHHGQIDAITEETLRAVAPKHVVCCASSDRRYESAHPEIVKMVERLGAQMHFTDPGDNRNAVRFTLSPNKIECETVLL